MSKLPIGGNNPAAWGRVPRETWEAVSAALEVAGGADDADIAALVQDAGTATGATISTLVNGAPTTLTWATSQPAQTGVLHTLTPSSPVTYEAGVPSLFQNGVVSTLPGGPLMLDFMAYGPSVAIQVYASSTTPSLRIKVDGRLITARAGEGPANPVSATTYWAHLTFPDNGPHRVAVACRQFRLRGVAYPTTGALAPAPVRGGARIAVIGDSFTGGSGDVGAVNTWAAHLGEFLGTDTPLLSGQGGSGFTVNGNGTVFTDAAVRLDPVIAANPTDIIIQGGRNDVASSATAVKAAAKSVFAYLAANAPEARLHVLLPVAGTDATQAAASWSATNTAIRSAANESENIYSLIDPTADGWFTTGNRPALVSSDDIHLNQAGHDYMAARVAGHIRDAVMGRGVERPMLTMYAADSFSRADGPLGSTEDGALAWTVTGSSGVGSVESSALKLVAAGAGWDGSQAVVDAGQSNVAVSAKNVGLGNIAGICARMSADGLTGYIFAAATSSWVLRRRDAYNSWVTLQSASVTPAAGQVARLVVDGATITAYIDGAQVAQVTDATHTGTCHGVYAVASTKYFDDFQVAAV